MKWLNATRRCNCINQIHWRNLNVIERKTQYRGKYKGIGKSTDTLNKTSSKCRNNQPDHVVQFLLYLL